MGNINTVGPNEALVISGSHSDLYRESVVLDERANGAFIYLFIFLPTDCPLDFNRTAFTDFVPPCVMF